MPSVSVNNLPNVSEVIRISKAAAMLDAILCEEVASRSYHFFSHWEKGDPSQMMAFMDNGCGDDYLIWFSDKGVTVKGFDHESCMSPYTDDNDGEPYPGVVDDLPEELDNFRLPEHVADKNDVTFCFWRTSEDSHWQSGNINFPDVDFEDVDGARWLLAIFDGDPATYVEYAQSYFNTTIDAEAVAEIYDLQPLTPELLDRLGCTRSLEQLAPAIAEIGYPQAAS